MKTIQTNNAPTAVGPYSQAIVVNDMVYCSGQIGLDPKEGTLVLGIEKQTKQVLKNLQAVLKAAGSDKKEVLKTTIFVKNISDFATVNEIYEAFFETHKPARATVGVSELPKGALVEIEAIALVNK